jgi:hypothetical protein
MPVKADRAAGGQVFTDVDISVNMVGIYGTGAFFKKRVWFYQCVT